MLSVELRSEQGKGELELTQSFGTSLHISHGTTDWKSVRGRLVFRGTVEMINLALRGLNYRANANENGHDRILIFVNDTQAGSGTQVTKDARYVNGSIDIFITSVNDPPTIDAPSVVSEAVSRGSRKSIFGISVSDIDIDGESGGK